MVEQITTVIGRVRRAQPRNADTMALCDELEKRAATAPVIGVAVAKITKKALTNGDCHECAKRKKKHAAAMKKWRHGKPEAKKK